MLTQLYLMKTLSGLHCGVGQGTGDIDQPTARDAVTGYPYAPGSSLKGVLRDHFANGPAGALAPVFQAVFGPDSASSSREPDRSIDFASCVAFGDAHLVCLPVRSYRGTFAYVTSPTALKLFQADLVRAGRSKLAALSVPELKQAATHEIALTGPGSLLALPGEPATVLLEELDLTVSANAAHLAATTAWAEGIAGLFPKDGPLDPALFKPRFAVVCDAAFDFLCETALPVATRNAIDDETGVVKDGALWSEEFIPAEAILAGLLHAERSRKHGVEAQAALDFLGADALELQIGGKATTGHGLVSLVLRPPTP